MIVRLCLLIITDLLVPGMNGFELARLVRKRNKINKYAPVIMLTTEKIDKQEACKQGCVAYSSKSDKKDADNGQDACDTIIIGLSSASCWWPEYRPLSFF